MSTHLRLRVDATACGRHHHAASLVLVLALVPLPAQAQQIAPAAGPLQGASPPDLSKASCCYYY